MIQQTIQDQELQLQWHRRRQQALTPRRLLHESDELLFWVEECYVLGHRIIPGWLLSRLVVMLRQAHPTLPSRLGRERRPAKVMAIIYDAQATLMDRACMSRGPAEVIPLFAAERALDQAAEL